MFVEQALPFVIANSDGSFSIGEDAAKALSSVDGRIVIVSVAGPYRTGKSYLLSQVLEQKGKGFPTGSTVEACTKGIFLWGTPIERIADDGQKEFVWLCDTEGLGGLKQDDTHDSRIFTLAILLSSFFVFNGVGSIDETALSQLSFVVNLTKHIHTRSRAQGDEETGEEYAAFFPAFLWVIRDFALRLVDPKGRSITANEYLDFALQERPGFSEEITAKNRVRYCLKEFFQERNCMTLVRPVEDEKKLQTLWQLPNDALRPEFREQVDVFKKMVLSAPTKLINGSPVNGRILVHLAREYVAALSKGSAPVISNAWDGVSQHECSGACAKGAKVFAEGLEAAARGKLPLDTYDLTQLYKDQKRKALATYEERALGDKMEKYRKELKIAIADRFGALCQENEKLSRELCARTLEQMYAPVEKKLAECSYQKLEQYEADWERIRLGYLSAARGPAKLPVLLEFVEQKIVQQIRLFTMQGLLGLEREKSELLIKMDEAQSAPHKMKLEVEQAKVALQKDLDKALQQAAELSGRESVLSQQLQHQSKQAEKDAQALSKLRVSTAENERKAAEQMETLRQKMFEMEKRVKQADLDRQRDKADFEAEKKKLNSALATAKMLSTKSFGSDMDPLAETSENHSPKDNVTESTAPATPRRTADQSLKRQTSAGRMSMSIVGSPRFDFNDNSTPKKLADDVKRLSKELHDLKREKADVDRMLLSKEKLIVKLTEELEKAKDSVLKMDKRSREKDDELRVVSDEKKAVHVTLAKAQATISKLQKDLEDAKKLESLKDTVKSLEDKRLNDVHSKEEIIETLQREKKAAEQALLQNQSAVEKLTAELKACKEVVETKGLAKASKTNEELAKEQRINELYQEKRTLEAALRVSQAASDKLSSELESVRATAEARDLDRTARLNDDASKDKVIADLMAQKKVLEHSARVSQTAADKAQERFDALQQALSQKGLHVAF
mmetsp:Transcript_35911/g.59851  ORF Transcript_35911/g.59851 Transcript_35911/m.59851 type:complete len:961 (+) Transcript_35911:92-2974(+)